MYSLTTPPQQVCSKLPVILGTKEARACLGQEATLREDLRIINSSSLSICLLPTFLMIWIRAWTVILLNSNSFGMIKQDRIIVAPETKAHRQELLSLILGKSNLPPSMLTTYLRTQWQEKVTSWVLVINQPKMLNLKLQQEVQFRTLVQWTHWICLWKENQWCRHV